MWVTEQRQNKREGILGPERHAELEAIPGWAWDKHQAVWQAHYVALRSFADREGHASPAQKHVEGNLNLGGWLANQRNRVDALTDTQRSQLEALPGWSWRPQDEAWERATAALRQYLAREGHSLVPTGHSENGFTLGRWVAKRRVLHRSGELPAELAHWLENQRGWTWEPRSDAWEQGFEALARYAQQHGTARA
jgi:Helicase associated domain